MPRGPAYTLILILILTGILVETTIVILVYYMATAEYTQEQNSLNAHTAKNLFKEDYIWENIKKHTRRDYFSCNYFES